MPAQITVAVTLDQALKNKYPSWGNSQVQSIFADAQFRFNYSYVMSMLWFLPESNIALFPRITLGPIDETNSLAPFTVTGCDLNVHGAVDIYSEAYAGRHDADAWFLLMGTEFLDTASGEKRVGCANQNGFCDCNRDKEEHGGYTNGFAFAVLYVWQTDVNKLGTAFAHELGHTFGAKHNMAHSNTIMHDELTEGQPMFSIANLQAMSNWIKGECTLNKIRTFNDPNRNYMSTDEMEWGGCD